MNHRGQQPRRRRPPVPMANAHALFAALQRRSASEFTFQKTARAVGPASSIETRFKP